MSEANKARAKRWFEEVWNKHRREAIAEMLAPDAPIHEGDQVSTGPDGFDPFFDRMSAAFSMPATNKRLEVTGISIVRVTDGNIAAVG